MRPSECGALCDCTGHMPMKLALVKGEGSIPGERLQTMHRLSGLHGEKAHKDTNVLKLKQLKWQ